MEFGFDSQERQPLIAVSYVDGKGSKCLDKPFNIIAMIKVSFTVCPAFLRAVYMVSFLIT